MQRRNRTQQVPAGTGQTAWVTGYAIGTTVVAAVVVLVSAILAYARSIAEEAPKINMALKQAERNTAPLAALQTTIEDASAITSGLQRGRARLGG
jgi:hypothetical protein